MTERIVLCLSLLPSQRVRTQQAQVHVETANVLIRRADAFGGTLCAWGWEGFSFAFHVDDLEEAIGFVTGSDAHPLLASVGVGISQGDLATLMDRRGSIELGWGTCLGRAMCLAQAAQQGEILIDADILAAHPVDLVTRGTRTTDGQTSVRGFILDPDEPWRQHAELNVARLGDPSMIGRLDALQVIHAEPGTLATVRADPGFGGTRFLAACAAAVAPAPVLVLGPGGHGIEPLSSLRRAFASALTDEQASRLQPHLFAAVKTLVSGDGIEPAVAVRLIESWLAPTDRIESGLLLIDDANDIDLSTLDCVAQAMAREPCAFRAVVRLDASSALPAVFAPLPPGPEVELLALSHAESERLVTAWMAGALPADAVTLWHRRAGGIPLAIEQALAEAISSGELAWRDDQACHRVDNSEHPGLLSAHEWIARRLRYVSSSERALLFAVAVLGGDAPAAMIGRVLEGACDIPVALDQDVDALTQRRWLIRPEPDRIALPSRTHRKVLLQALPESHRAAWHRAASLAIENSLGKMARAEAAFLAAIAHDGRRAARLALQAADAAKDFALDSAANALIAFARTQDADALDVAEPSGLSPVPPLAASIAPAAGESFVAALLERAASRELHQSYPPIDVPRARAARPQTAVSVAEMPLPPPPAVPRGMSPRPAMRQAREQDPEAPPSTERSRAADSHDARSREVLRMASELPVLGREALLSGDQQAVERWVSQMGSTGSRDRLVTRLRAMLALSTGQQAQALRALRDGCEQATTGGPLERSRCHLAYSIGLAQAGRLSDALTEGLAALARAREASDPKAEKACLLFMHKLYSSAGHDQLAQRWTQPRS